jgi:hypothetical protein
MTDARSDWFKLALAHNNAAGLKALHLISAPLFAHYAPKGGVLTDWNDGEETERDGSGALQTIGFPFVQFTLYSITPAEFVLLNTYIGNVTGHLYNKTANTWANYNGVLELPIDARKWGTNEWDEVGGVIYELEPL